MVANGILLHDLCEKLQDIRVGDIVGELVRKGKIVSVKYRLPPGGVRELLVPTDTGIEIREATIVTVEV